MLDVNSMQAMSEQFIYLIHGKFKQARIGHENVNVISPAIKVDIRLCVIHTLSVYLSRSEHVCNSSQLFIRTVRLHKAVTKDTTARLIKVTLYLASIDVAMFKPHCTWAAVTSAAHR